MRAKQERVKKAMTQATANLMYRVLEATYARLDDFNIEVVWTYGGYVVDVTIDHVEEPVRLSTVDDCIDEIARWND